MCVEATSISASTSSLSWIHDCAQQNLRPARCLLSACRRALGSTPSPPYKQWSAPEVCAGSTSMVGTVANTATDVYMLGSLVYEVLTGATMPFHWLCTDMSAALFLGKRRATGLEQVRTVRAGCEWCDRRGWARLLSVCSWGPLPVCCWYPQVESTPGTP